MNRQDLFIWTDEFGVVGVFTTTKRVLERASKYVIGEMYFYNLDGRTKVVVTTKTLKKVLNKTSGITLFRETEKGEFEICDISKRLLNLK